MTYSGRKRAEDFSARFLPLSLSKNEFFDKLGPIRGCPDRAQNALRGAVFRYAPKYFSWIACTARSASARAMTAESLISLEEII